MAGCENDSRQWRINRFGVMILLQGGTEIRKGRQSPTDTGKKRFRPRMDKRWCEQEGGVNRKRADDENEENRKTRQG